MHPLIAPLKALRLKLGLTQEQLAVLSGIAQPNIARLENGGPFTANTYDRVLAALQQAERNHNTTAQAVSEELDYGTR